MPGLRVVSSDDAGMVLELEAPPYDLQSSPDGRGFQRLIVGDPGFSYAGAPGEARLPVKSVLIGVPVDAEINLRILTDVMGKVQHKVQIEPAPFEQPELLPNFAANPESALALTDPMSAYGGTEAVYPTTTTAAADYSPVRLGEPGYLRDQRIVRLTFQPFEYRANQEVRVHQRLRVEITFAVPAGAPASRSDSPRSDPYFEPLFKQSLLNYERARGWRTAPDSDLSPIAASSASHSPASGQSLPPTRLRIHTDQDGLYAISYNDIAATGANLTKITPRSFRLESQGVERAIIVEGEADGHFDPGDVILFYGQGSTSRYTRETVYWLSWGAENGLRMAARNVEPGRGGEPVAGHRQTDHIERNLTYLSSVPPTGEADRWYWDRFQVGGRNPIDTLTYTATLSAPMPGQAATLRVTARGFTTWFDINPDHHLLFYVNDQLVGGGVWDGQDLLDQTVSFASDLLVEGQNVLKLVAPDDTGASTDVGYSNFLELSYPRRLQAIDDHLVFDRDGGSRGLFEVGGFAGEPVEAYDLTDPTRPLRLEGGVLASAGASGGVFRFSDDTPAAARYLTQTLARRLHPAAVSGDVATTYRSPDNQADYLIISHANFLDAIAPLGAYRQSQGMRVLVIDVQDIYDEFSYGETTPEAIHSFLDYAFHNWQAPAPAYVLLVGDGTYDPLNYKNGDKKNFIPPLLALVDPFLKETATDNRLVTVEGADALPDMYIGRFPANSPAEVTTMVDKTVQYETQPWPGDWKNRILFVADNADTAGDFASLSDEVADHLLPPGPYNDQKQKIYLGITHSSSIAARADIINAFNNGLFLSNYTGHGQVQHWASEFILRIEDSSNLINGRRLPVHLSMTCLDGRFHEIGSDAQAEVLLRNPSGGAVAVWAATGLGVAHGHDLMHQGFYAALFEHGQTNLGALVEAGKLELYTGDTLGIFQDLLDTFVLLGDPALHLGLATTDLAIEPTSSPTQPLAPGDLLTLRYQVKNQGQMAAPDVFVSVSLPQMNNLTAVSDAGPVAIEPGPPTRFGLGTLAPGATVELTIGGVLAEGLEIGQFAISAETDADWEDSNPANNISPQVLIRIIGADAGEPNDGRQAATLLPVPGRLAERTYYPDGDQDWFIFQAEAGVRYRFITDRLSIGGDTLLVLYDAAGSELLRSDNAGPGALWSTIDWQTPTDGPFYLMVTGAGGAAGSFLYDLVASRDYQHYLPMLRLDDDKPLSTATPTPRPPTPTPTPSATLSASPTHTPTSTPTLPPTPTRTPMPTATPGGEVCMPRLETVLPLAGAPKALIATGNRVLAGLYDINAVAVVDGQTQDLLGSHASGGALPNGLTVWNNRYFVSHRNDNLVSIFDLSTDQLLARFETGAMPWGLAVGPDNLLYVANFDSDTVTVHDPISGALVDSTPISGSPSQVLSYNGRVWVTRQSGGSGLVSISASGAIVTPVPGVPAGATYMAVDERSGLIYTSHPGLRRIYVIDSTPGKVVATFNAPGSPYALAVNTATNQLYAVDAGRSLLYILDINNGAFLGQISVGLQTVEHGGQGLALLNGLLYVANDAERTITVYDAGPCAS